MAWSKETDNVMVAIARAATLAALLTHWAVPAAAQGIYTCIDAKGRRLTADRPIIDCIDREQTELSPGGLPRRKIAPTMTAAELAAEEEKARRQEEERNRLAEEKRKERALVIRYPNQAVHDEERQAVLTRVDAAKAAAQRRITELLAQRKFLESELEFYKFAPDRVPPKIRQQREQVASQLEAQRLFLLDQDVVRLRIIARFDQELARLKLLWAQQAQVPTVAGGRAPAPVSLSRPASSSATR